MRIHGIAFIAASVAALLASPAVSAVPVQFGAQAAATPAADQAANAPAQTPDARLDGGLAAEDMGLVFSLPTGWKRDDNPAGSKYRYFDTDGAPLGSLLIFKPMNSQRLMDLFGGTEDDILDAALSERVDRELKGYERYQPAATTKRKIAGYDGLVHDFTFLSQGQPVFSRWVIFDAPGKAADPTVKVAPTVQQFAFTVVGVDRVAEFKRQWGGILDSMRVKGAPVPPPPPTKNEAHMPPVPPVKPELKTEGGLPDLQADEPGPGLYAEPFGRYQVALPEGAVQVKIEENAAYYKMPAPKTGFIIHSYRQDEIGPRLAARFAEGRKLNGAPSTLNVGGREAVISLYTAKDAAGENMVWVAALYPKSGLLIVVNLPAKDYAGAKEWIGALVRGVRF